MPSSLGPRPSGPTIQTFMVRIPFVLGITDQHDHRIDLPVDYFRPEDASYFGEKPFVNIRMFNAPIADDLFWPENMPKAAAHFYRGDIGPPDEGHHLHEQWLSLETPSAVVVGEDPNDPAAPFHRCLFVLNLFLQALGLARDDDRLRPVSARELRPIVTVGALTADLRWHYLGPMLMHPDAPERSERSGSMQTHMQRLNSALGAVMNQEPFITSKEWAARARRRQYEGDAADSIVSFQIATETLLYDLVAMLMVDAGRTSIEIARRRRSSGFKRVLTRDLPEELGGSWNRKAGASPVGQYWQAVYMTRNRIVHEGYQAHDGDSEQAAQAYAALSGFIDERLWVSRRKYPRTMLLRLTRAGLAAKGRADVTERSDDLEAEPTPYYLPRDVAGRPR